MITKSGEMPSVTGVWQTLCLNIVMLHRYQTVSGSSRTRRERLVPPMVNKMEGGRGKHSMYKAKDQMLVSLDTHVITNLWYSEKVRSKYEFAAVQIL